MTKKHEYPAKKAYEALEDWLDKEIVDASARHAELFRFLFGVSATSTIAFTSIARLTNLELSCNIYFVLANVSYLISIVIVLFRLLSPLKPIGGGYDINEEYNETVMRNRKTSGIWLTFWVIGICLSIISFAH